MSQLLQIESLKKHFPLDKESYVAAVNGVSFTMARGETLGLVGESGSGKTTVGRCALRLLEPTAGRVDFDGRDLTELSEKQLRAMRARMQLVFQEPFASLNPRRTVRQTVEEPLRLERKLDRAARAERVAETLAAVNLGEELADSYPVELTTGEQQRVGIARAIATRPELVVLDEPTSNLDPSVRSEILDVLIRLQEELEMSYLFISHDLTAVERISHRIAVMYLGRIVEVAPVEALMERQYHPYTRALLSAVLFPDPHRKLEPFTLEGEIPSAINPKDECSLIGRCPFAQERCRTAFPPLEEVAPGHFAACYRSRELERLDPQEPEREAVA
jgi:oligopeptide/dipeptide ABC transporter ATP-binding protein